MLHIFLLLFGVIWGVVICVMLFSFSVKAQKGTWLITIPAILIVAILAINFSGHMLRLPPSTPYQHQIVTGVKWTARAMIVPLLGMKLYELWSKKRARAAALAHAQSESPSP